MIELETVSIDEADGGIRTEQGNGEHFRQVTADLDSRLDLAFGLGFGRRVVFVVSFDLSARSVIQRLVRSGILLGPLRARDLGELSAVRFLDFLDLDTEVVGVAREPHLFLCRICSGRGAWFLNGSTPALVYQLLSNAGRSPCKLTVNDQPRHIFPFTRSGVVWLDLEDMQRVGPVDRAHPRTGDRSVTAQDDQVGRGVLLVHHPAPEASGVVDVVVLTFCLQDTPEVGLRQDLEDSVCRLHQLWVEGFLEPAYSFAQLAVLLVVFAEFRVGFDHLDGQFPSPSPAIWDVQDALHEDEVDENSGTEIFADVILVIGAIIPADSDPTTQATINPGVRHPPWPLHVERTSRAVGSMADVTASQCC